MAKLSLNVPIDLIALDLTFPVGGTPTAKGFQIDSGTGWRLDVVLTDLDIATDATLSQDVGGKFETWVEITDIDRPVVYPVGGTVQSLLSLMLDRRDLLIGSDGNDGLAGYAGADRLRGGDGDDILSGGGDNDRLAGGRGFDRLYGERGDDLLNGGGGRDVLAGGSGNDILTGGTGGDTFRFRTGDGADTITDFELGIDRIRIGQGAAGLDELTFAASGSDVVVSFADVALTVQNVTVAELNDGANFLF